jgi:ABC-2 type transport system ATP-binding protein
MESGEMNNDAVVSITGLSRRFGKKVALDNVSLEVPRGGVFGLVGENGAGKTTLIKHMLGLYRAQRGTVRVFGLDPVQAPEKTLVRIGYLSEDRDMPPWMRVRELMRYQQALYPGWDGGYAEDLLRVFELDRNAKLRTLSRGELAKAGLLSALAHRPDLLLLDEPSSGLDVIVRHEILTAIIRTVAEEGRTVIFSSHLLEEVERVSDRVAMIYKGRVAINDTMDAIRERHQRIQLRWPNGRQDTPKLPGQLSCRGAGADWTVFVEDAADAAQAAAQRAGAQVLGIASASLEEVFVAHAASGQQRED